MNEKQKKALEEQVVAIAEGLPTSSFSEILTALEKIKTQKEMEVLKSINRSEVEQLLHLYDRLTMREGVTFKTQVHCSSVISFRPYVNEDRNSLLLDKSTTIEFMGNNDRWTERLYSDCFNLNDIPEISKSYTSHDKLFEAFNTAFNEMMKKYSIDATLLLASIENGTLLEPVVKAAKKKKSTLRVSSTSPFAPVSTFGSVMPAAAGFPTEHIVVVHQNENDDEEDYEEEDYDYEAEEAALQQELLELEETTNSESEQSEQSEQIEIEDVIESNVATAAAAAFADSDHDPL